MHCIAKFHEIHVVTVLYIKQFMSVWFICSIPVADLGGGEPAHTPLNCTHPHGNDCLMAKKQVELLPVLARKVFIYT